MKKYLKILCIIAGILMFCGCGRMKTIPERITNNIIKNGIDSYNHIMKSYEEIFCRIKDNRYLITYSGQGKRKVAIYDLNSLDKNTFHDYVIGDRHSGNFSFTRNAKDIFLEYAMDNTSVSSTPYFTYYDSEGAVRLELYFDGTEQGCGICYDDFWEEYSGKLEGFIFTECYERQWKESDYCVTLTGSDLENFRENARNYREWFEYNETGQITEFHAQGEFNWFADEDEWKLMDIADCYMEYYDDGTLKKREIYKNSMLFETWYSSQKCYFDRKGRIVYIWSYVTHGFIEDYFIYENDSNIPAYDICIDHNSRDCVPVFYKYTEEK